jgi:hypothetical protein
LLGSVSEPSTRGGGGVVPPVDAPPPPHAINSAVSALVEICRAIFMKYLEWVEWLIGAPVSPA